MFDVDAAPERVFHATAHAGKDVDRQIGIVAQLAGLDEHE